VFLYMGYFVCSMNMLPLLIQRHFLQFAHVVKYIYLLAESNLAHDVSCRFVKNDHSGLGLELLKVSNEQV
jgi:hypothetical protein